MNNPLISLIFCISLIVCISISYYANFIILAVLLAYASNQHHVPIVIKAVARVRWLLVFIILITSLSTPGELIQPVAAIDIWPAHFIPTYEGCLLGVMQSIRLVCLITAISLLTTSLKRDVLISAVYHLLLPATLLGFDAEKFAARLCLTLEYMQKPLSFSESLNQLNTLRQADNSNNLISHQAIELAIITLNDWQLMLIFLVSLLPFVVHYFN